MHRKHAAGGPPSSLPIVQAGDAGPGLDRIRLRPPRSAGRRAASSGRPRWTTMRRCAARPVCLPGAPSDRRTPLAARSRQPVRWRSALGRRSPRSARAEAPPAAVQVRAFFGRSTTTPWVAVTRCGHAHRLCTLYETSHRKSVADRISPVSFRTVECLPWRRPSPAPRANGQRSDECGPRDSNPGLLGSASAVAAHQRHAGAGSSSRPVRTEPRAPTGACPGRSPGSGCRATCLICAFDGCRNTARPAALVLRRAGLCLKATRRIDPPFYCEAVLRLHRRCAAV